MSGFRAIQLLDENGIPYGVKHIDNIPRVLTTTFEQAVSNEMIDGYRAIRIHGQNNDVDSTREDCINFGGTYSFPSTGGTQMEVVGAEPTDASGSTGVQQVEIHYLDTHYEEQREQVWMSGATVMTTVATDIIRINAFHAIKVGSTGFAGGTIVLRGVGGGTTYAQIDKGLNVALQAIYTIPANKKLCITDWTVGAGSAAGSRYCEFLLRATAHDDFGDIEYNANLFNVFDIVAAQDASYQRNFNLHLCLPPKTDIKVSVKSDAATANAETSCGINGYLKPI